MDTNQQEAGRVSEPVFEINEWFNPFSNYDSLPYNETYYEDSDPSKNVYFNVNHLGRFSAEIYTEPNVGNYPVIALGPKSAQRTTAKVIPEIEKRSETKHVEISIWADQNFVNQKLPYKIQLRLPEGEILESPFEDETELDPPKAIIWSDEEGEEVQLHVPNTEYMLEQLEFRFVPN